MIKHERLRQRSKKVAKRSLMVAILFYFNCHAILKNVKNIFEKFSMLLES